MLAVAAVFAGDYFGNVLVWEKPAFVRLAFAFLALLLVNAVPAPSTQSAAITPLAAAYIASFEVIQNWFHELICFTLDFEPGTQGRRSAWQQPTALAGSKGRLRRPEAESDGLGSMDGPGTCRLTGRSALQERPCAHQLPLQFASGT